MGPLLGAALASVVIVAAGLPAGYLVARRLPLALLFAPLATALAATVAVILMITCGGPFVGWLLAVLVAQYGLVFLLLRHRPRAPLPHAGWVDCLCYAVPLVPPFTALRLAPTQWDAHSIWWTHAAYFTSSGAIARAQLGNPWMYFSHTDYPPLLSAAVAVAWRVSGPNFWTAQAASAVVTFAGIALLAYAVRTVTAIGPPVLSRLAGVLVALSAWGFAVVAPAGGLADPLWASTFVAGCVMLLVGPTPGGLTLPLLLLTVSALTKNEGFIAVAELAVLTTLRDRRDLHRAWRLWLPVAAGFLWSRLARHYGATSDLVAGGHFAEFLHGDPAVWHRLRPIGDSMATLLGLITGLSAVSAALGTAFLRRQRAALGLGADLWLWLAYGLFFVTLTITYLTSPNDIAWHLATSADRVTVPLTLLVVASSAIWGVTAYAACVGTDGAGGGTTPAEVIMPAASLKLTTAAAAPMKFAPGGKP
jgi:hypothetical protein